MKITLSRQDLLDAVNKVKTVVPSKPGLPILSHILIETLESSVRLTATDLKVTVECHVDCQVIEPGAVTVPCSRLASIIQELPPADVTLTLSDGTVTLTCNKINTKLFTMAVDEYPPTRDFEGIEPVVLPQGIVKSLFLKTAFSMCQDQARHNLVGALFELANGRLTVVTTDGRRMSLCRQSEGIPEELAEKVIIPAKVVHELARLLNDDATDTVSIYIKESQAWFCFGNVRVISGLIEGNFPNYEMVIPKDHDKIVTVATSAFGESIRRVLTMTNERFNAVRLVIRPGMAGIRAVTPDVGEYEEDLPVEYEGEPIDISFNPSFLGEVIKNIHTPAMAMVLRDGQMPGLFQQCSPEGLDNSYLNVIMPIRL